VAVMGAVDSVFQNLSKTVLQYQQHVLSSKVCWKDSLERETKRPDQCPPNHYWDGDAWCFGMREGSGTPLQIKNRHGICIQARSSRRASVSMSGCDRSHPNQQWVFERSTGHIKKLGGFCLDAADRDTPEGRVLMWPCEDGNKNQEWQFTEATGQIKNRYGICLDAAQFSTDGGQLQMYTCDESAKNQQWDMSEDIAGPVLLETSFGWKNPSGALPAQCATDGDFAERRGGWCYKACPSGTEVAGSSCRSACVGAYPVDSMLMCGKSPGTIAAAVQEMVVRSLRTGLTVHGIVSSSGPAGGLQGTITSLVDFGSGLAHPYCPLPDGAGN